VDDTLARLRRRTHRADRDVPVPVATASAPGTTVPGSVPIPTVVEPPAH
jgi:hypothetical protein